MLLQIKRLCSFKNKDSRLITVTVVRYYVSKLIWEHYKLGKGLNASQVGQFCVFIVWSNWTLNLFFQKWLLPQVNFQFQTFLHSFSIFIIF